MIFFKYHPYNPIAPQSLLLKDGRNNVTIPMHQLRTRSIGVPKDLTLLKLLSENDKEWCDEVLGCLYITDDWYSDMRPINVNPASRSSINTRFMLHTREDRAAETVSWTECDV